MQIVEIARALARGARCVLLDEPTAALERDAVRRLFGQVRQLTAGGVAVLYISHHLEEVFEICDDVSVLRDGELVLTAPADSLAKEDLVVAMVGAAAQMPDCAAPTQVSFEYKNTSGAFKPLADPTVTPTDLAMATVNGRSVPYIVRVETGTIDRAVYQTAALYDGQAPTPLRPDTSWNGKLVYTFGGGCDAGFHQGNSTGGVLDDEFLSLGYAVASSTLNVLDNNCSTIISAESAMMVKEPNSGRSAAG